MLKRMCISSLPGLDEDSDLEREREKESISYCMCSNKWVNGGMYLYLNGCEKEEIERMY